MNGSDEVFDQKISLVVSERQRAAIDRIVVDERRSLAFVVREAIDAYLADHRTP